MKTHLLSRSAALALVLAPKSLLACAVCLGGSDSTIRPAVNAAIFLMLGFIGTALTGVGSFAVYLYRRSRLPHPPHEQFLQNHDEV
ncbi:MAG: hypothetical protein QOD99_2672 [Chthoniobacter sp.]|nr:hypothetical protein [Chthoniobacter sp.]